MSLNTKVLFARAVPVLVAAAVGLGFSQLQPLEAQKGASKVGFVDIQKALEADPKGAAVGASKKKLEGQLRDIQTQLVPLQNKGAAATAAEKKKITDLQKIAQDAITKYQTDSKAQLAPVEKALNSLIASTAKAQGFTIVMDRAAAATSGLVVYADVAATDITDTVIKSMKK